MVIWSTYTHIKVKVKSRNGKAIFRLNTDNAMVGDVGYPLPNLI